MEPLGPLESPCPYTELLEVRCEYQKPMEIIIISLVCATGSLILLAKTIGFRKMVRWQLPIDVILTIGLPILFIGTFSGMATAFISGLIVSIFLYFSKLFVRC